MHGSFVNSSMRRDAKPPLLIGTASQAVISLGDMGFLCINNLPTKPWVSLSTQFFRLDKVMFGGYFQRIGSVTCGPKCPLASQLPMIHGLR